jgi:hypothetical protein
MPPRSAELAVGDRLQADRFLPADDVLDFAVFDLPQAGGVDLVGGVSGPSRITGTAKETITIDVSDALPWR